MQRPVVHEPPDGVLREIEPIARQTLLLQRGEDSAHAVACEIDSIATKTPHNGGDYKGRALNRCVVGEGFLKGLDQGVELGEVFLPFHVKHGHPLALGPLSAVLFQFF